MFHLDVAKVDRDVAHVAMARNIYMLQVYIPKVSSIFLDVYCKHVYLNVAYIFTHMLKVFYMDVAYVCNGFQVFLQMF